MSDFSSWALLAILVLILGFCVYRWARIAPIYRGLQVSELADPRLFSHAHRTFQDLVARAWQTRRWQPRPRLMVIRGDACCAFTMGILSPVVAISAGLVEQLGEPELQGVVAHELAHVRRCDYIGRWLATVVRDLMIWNPFALLWYRQLVQEQEKASDAWAAAMLDDPGAVASGLVEVAAYAGGFPLTSIGQLAAWRPGESMSHLGTRLDCLEDIGSGAASDTRWRSVVDCTLLGAFALVQPHIVLPLVWLLGRARHLV
jgi:Zn-dependent protease with chaperone function